MSTVNSCNFTEKINYFSMFQNKNNKNTKNENANINTFPNDESTNNISFQNNISHHNLISLIQILQQENSLLKSNLNIGQNIEPKYSDTIQYKMLSLKNEIENLKRIITNKDNIIMNMQNFINNMNKIILNGKINLNVNQIDLKTFNINLKQLEQDIITKFQKMQKYNKIAPPKSNKEKQNILERQKTEPSFNDKQCFYSIPLNKKTNKTNVSLKLNFNKKLFFKKINKTMNEEIIKGIKCNINKNDEYADVRCVTCRKKSKNNEKFYRERQKLRLKGFLSFKPNGLFSRTPKRQYIKSIKGK